MKLRNLALSAAGLLIVACSATAVQAADWLSPSPADRWSGLYGGGQLGYGSASLGGTYSGTMFGVTTTGAVKSYGMSGFAGGGQIGFNRQSDAFVYGAEAGVLGATVSGSGQQFTGSTTITATSHINFLATARVRVGVAFDRLLVYGAGGVAAGQGDLTLAATGGTTGTAHATQGLFGWTAGVGAAYALDDRWSLGVDYQHLDLGNTVYSDPANIPSGSATVHLTANVVTGRVDYRF